MNRGRDFLVGLVFFGLLIVLGVFTTILADFSFGSAPKTTVVFDRVDGLVDGAAVWINGVKSGKVAKVSRDAEANNVRVEIEFDEDPHLNADAEFRIESISLLGGKVVSIANKGTGELDLSKVQEGKPPADMLAKVEQAAGDLSEMIAENKDRISSAIASVERTAKTIESVVADRREQIETIVDDLAVAVGEAKGILADNRGDIRTAVENLAGVSRGLAQSGPAVLESLRNAADKIEAVAAKVDTGDGLIPTLINDPELAENVKAAVADIREFTGSAKSSKGTFGRLMNDPALYDEAVAAVKSLRASADRIDAALNSSDNTVGMLLTDRQMADNIRNSVQEISRFLENQRENAPLTTFAGLLFSPF